MIANPFRGIRPDRKYVTLVNVPPYDVVSGSDVKKAVQNNPFSFFHITRADADIPGLPDEYSESVYRKARENYESFIRDSILIKDEKESFYLISQTWMGKTQTGLYAAVSCREYEDNLIKKHELTRRDKEIDRTNHISTVKADTGPVFLAFDDRTDMTGFINIVKPVFDKLPVYDFIDENRVDIKLWIVSEPKIIQALKDYFAKIGAFYIADGHHRAASAVNVWKKAAEDLPAAYSHFLAVVFPSSQLRILPYNRAVQDLNGYSCHEFLDRLKNIFTIKSSSSMKPAGKGDIGMYLEKSYYIMKAKDPPTHEDLLDSLDVSVLQKLVLSPILGIEDPRTSARLRFIGGSTSEEEMVKIVDNGQAKVAFSLFPVNITDLIKITEASKLMPPKSTWFEPKLRDGLVVYSLE